MSAETKKGEQLKVIPQELPQLPSLGIRVVHLTIDPNDEHYAAIFEPGVGEGKYRAAVRLGCNPHDWSGVAQEVLEYMETRGGWAKPPAEENQRQRFLELHRFLAKERESTPQELFKRGVRYRRNERGEIIGVDYLSEKDHCLKIDPDELGSSYYVFMEGDILENELAAAVAIGFHLRVLGIPAYEFRKLAELADLEPSINVLDDVNKISPQHGLSRLDCQFHHNPTTGEIFLEVNTDLDPEHKLDPESSTQFARIPWREISQELDPTHEALADNPKSEPIAENILRWLIREDGPWYDKTRAELENYPTYRELRPFAWEVIQKIIHWRPRPAVPSVSPLIWAAEKPADLEWHDDELVEHHHLPEGKEVTVRRNVKDWRLIQGTVTNPNDARLRPDYPSKDDTALLRHNKKTKT